MDLQQGFLVFYLGVSCVVGVSPSLVRPCDTIHYLGTLYFTPPVREVQIILGALRP